jgi:cyclopropane-fatty-acyl-phospholipid synthase
VNRTALALVERGLVPDALTRRGIRALVRQRLVDDVPSDLRAQRDAIERMRAAMAAAPVAVETEAANQQHYEVPAEFYEIVLGQHLKYSSCFYPTGDETLDEAEADMLARTCERAALEDGQDILELGCGWGSLTLWMAAHYPNATITAVSNSASQRRFIERRAADRGLDNVTILTHDMNTFEPPARYDRVVSVEMFEHMRNWSVLLERVASWMRPEGRLFLHVFCHTMVPYFFEDEGDGDWMARHFFTGGLMPSLALPGEVTTALEVEEQWVVPGTHYARTARQWLERLDARRSEVEEIFGRVYGPLQATRWVERWRVFFMACEELFGFAGGDEWVVGHTRLRRSDPPT